ncbi:helix-turn-helix domain-containing protein [Ochrobactrum daejeonense]|nr:helix-turn-helix domain-containing protein [Brucella daejeonensis]
MAEVDAICSGSAATISLMLEKEELEYICGKSLLSGTVIRGSTALGRLIGELFRSSYREAGELSFKEGVDCGDTLINLIASAVKHDHDNIRSAPSDQLRNQVLDFINRNIHDPKLGVDHILERFAMSRSHLYRLLEADGGAAGLIRRKRLQLAHGELVRHRADQNLRIKEIAVKYGFSNAGQFARSFQQQFSIPPSDFLKRQKEDERHASQITRLHSHYGNLHERWNDMAAA